jgi:hypothetical protein
MTHEHWAALLRALAGGLVLWLLLREARKR